MIRRLPISTLFPCPTLFLFFFNDTATTEIYTLSLHDALPICCTHRSACPLRRRYLPAVPFRRKLLRRTLRFLGLSSRKNAVCLWQDLGKRVSCGSAQPNRSSHLQQDRKSTRLNSSHQIISYAV